VNALPDHTRRLAERMLDAYCRRICPPEFREQVVLGWRVGELGVTLHEVRRICGVPGTARLVDVALLRYDARRATWRLFHRNDADDGGAVRWRRYPLAPQRSLSALMRELDEDAFGLFWPRLNGASLRWCSARGRCAGCTQRYRSALGAAESPREGTVAIPIEPQRGTG
jgi:hypothetical protein